MKSFVRKIQTTNLNLSILYHTAEHGHNTGRIQIIFIDDFPNILQKLIKNYIVYENKSCLFRIRKNQVAKQLQR